jgi:serralysin
MASQKSYNAYRGPKPTHDKGHGNDHGHGHGNPHGGGDDDTATPASEPTPYLLEDGTGTGTWRDKPIYDHDQVIEQLDSGTQQVGDVITFDFLTAADAAGQTAGEYAGFSVFSAAQEQATRESMALWDDLIAPHIVEGGGASADIVLSNTTTGPAQAWAYMPYDDGDDSTPQSAIWVASPEQQWDNGWVTYGGYGRTTLVHEIGHSLGLSHPGDYNNGADNDGDGQPDPISYGVDAVYAQDSTQFTIMSYFPNQSTGAQTWEPSLLTVSTAQTPLLHDILAIQSIYGADPTTRVGDTVYFANSTAGNAVYDLDYNPFPYLSVYDAGGNDTFDFSTANEGVFLDLRPGAFSSASAGYLPYEEAVAAMEAYNDVKPDGSYAVTWNTDMYAGWIGAIAAGGAVSVEADTGVGGVTTTMVRNISIAYNTTIENAVGGSARDYLVGNDVDNVLKGNGGDDVLNGLGGDDQLWGGAGADTFVFFDNSGKDVIRDFLSGTDKIDLSEIDANSDLDGDQAFAFIGSSRFHGDAGELRGYFDHGTYYLAGDVDGDGRADFTIDLGHAKVMTSDLFL